MPPYMPAVGYRAGRGVDEELLVRHLKIAGVPTVEAHQLRLDAVERQRHFAFAKRHHLAIVSSLTLRDVVCGVVLHGDLEDCFQLDAGVLDD